MRRSAGETPTLPEANFERRPGFGVTIYAKQLGEEVVDLHEAIGRQLKMASACFTADHADLTD